MAKQPKQGSRGQKPKPVPPQRSALKKPVEKKATERRWRIEDLDNVEPWFWEVIGRARRSPEKLRQLLRAMSRQELERFHSQFEWAVAGMCADDFRDVHGYTRDQMLDDLAGWVVSQGKDYYARIWENPDKLPREEDIDERSQLDGIAAEIYVERFGQSPPYTG
jgi:hypothetical protein